MLATAAKRRRWFGPPGGGLVLIVASLAALAGDPGATFTIRGVVVDGGGRPVPDHPVVLFQSRNLVELFPPRIERHWVEQGRTLTGADGRFTLELDPDPRFPYTYLRPYDPESFDAVRYELPEDVDVSRSVGREPGVVVRIELVERPQWPEVARRIREVGPDSPRARVLRAHGLPDEIEHLEHGAGARENWWYYRAGIGYQFADGALVKSWTFEPVTSG